MTFASNLTRVSRSRLTRSVVEAGVVLVVDLDPVLAVVVVVVVAAAAG